MRNPCTTHETGPCANCGRDVPMAAVKCSHCGYHVPTGGHVTDLLHLIIGNLLTLTVLGAVIGVPLMRRALHRLQQQSYGTVVQHET